MKSHLNSSRFKYCTLFILLSLYNLLCQAQDINTIQTQRVLDLKESTFTSVLGGNIISTPQKTSYGYIAYTEGRLITAFTQDGKILWQKGMKGRPFSDITVGADDIFYTLSDKTVLSMHNPSGLVLWSQDTDIYVTEPPLLGKDGRVFIRNESSIACYGTNGICRWNLTTNLLNTAIPLNQLNDGSLLAVLEEKTSDGRSKALRISPFGKILEEISFTSTINSMHETESGIFISFTDGNSGLCKVENGNAISKWTIQTINNRKINVSTFIQNSFFEEKIYFYNTQSDKIIILNEKTGKIITETETIGFSKQNILWASSTAQGIVLISIDMAICIDESGIILWSADLSKTSRWNHILATDNGNIIFCTSDWTIKGIQIWKTPGTQKSSFKKKELKSYSEFYSFENTISSNFITKENYEEITNGFKNGNFGEKEEIWLPFIETQINNLYSDWLTENLSFMDGKPYFQANIQKNQMVLSMIQESGSTIYQKKIAVLLKKIKDPSVLTFLVETAAGCSYDPDLEMLNALAYLTAKNTLTQDELFQIKVCDATYNICRYMGKTAFLEKGQEIIAKLINPIYPQKTRNYAMQTIRKIMDLKI